MKKKELFNTAMVSNVIGCTLLGIGIGKFFNEYWVGTLTGLGIGLIITTIILLKTVNKLNDCNDT
tara:strand:- start:3125 stop:3319 length:195 start_codon:yes stop_codon:yes gene_type:complete